MEALVLKRDKMTKKEHPTLNQDIDENKTKN